MAAIRPSAETPAERVADAQALPPRIVFGRPALGQEEIDEVVDALRSGWIGTGPRVRAFEKMFADYVGARHAVALNSCTAGLHLALLTLDLAPDDEVIVPAMTFAATASAVIHAHGRPVLADVRRDTMCLDPTAAAAQVTPRTRALVAVHFAGRPCELDRLEEIRLGRGLRLLEDCAHAVESTVDGRHCGTFGDFASFSFHATKNVTTGDGGMLVTDDEDAAEAILRLAQHGLSNDAWSRTANGGPGAYDVAVPGFKYRMTDIQAAIGIHQLARVEHNLPQREQIHRWYDEAFADLPVVLVPAAAPGARHARHLYTLLLDLEHLDVDRDAVRRELSDEGIGTGVHYRAIHLEPFLRDRFGYARGDFPAAEWISDRTLSLPLSPGLSSGDVRRVVRAVRLVLRRHTR
ncbi:MAG TPA: DegT/DnrJ/EryC1/StrS family aminotransferase [Gaiellaceae bacterium]|nr:DegT/DnrJ/EryC1/StrS family aminotransferase [Gaiellaceae bacterium]